MTGAHVVRVWSKEEPFLGAELADVTVGDSGLSARAAPSGRVRFRITSNTT